ncbi:hypothetical protein ACJJTC_004921 [Scirpophaga incertulas]
MSDPLDPGGGDWGDADSSPPLFSPQTDTDVENPSINSRKRGPSDQNSVLPSKKTSLVQATASIQSTYVCPDLINKKKYSENDSAPFIVYINKLSSDPSSGAVLHPIKFGQFLHKNNIKNIKPDGVKRIGRNRISVEFKSYNDANAFLDHPALALAKYEALIPSHHITRMGIVRQVPVEWSLEEIVDAIEIPQGFGSIVRARRLNRKTFTDGSPVWIPTQTIVFTFAGQKLPPYVYCFYTSLLVETYILPTIQCNKCCRFGHIQSQCRSLPRCFVCAQPHDGSSCSQVTPTCLLCLGNHRANNPICPEHHRQKQLKIIMSQENITYSEASVRVPRVRKSFTDTVRSGFIEPVLSDSSLPPSTQPSPSIPTSSSYRKTVYVTKNLPKSAASPGYDRQALSNIVRPPSFQSPDGHCLQNGNHRQDNNDHFIEMLLASAISILSRFDDIELPDDWPSPSFEKQ